MAELALESVTAIDVHVHPWTEEMVQALGERGTHLSRYFGSDLRPVSFDELADAYRGRQMMAVLLAIDDETTSGLPPFPNAKLAEAVRKHYDVFRGFVGIDPWKGKLALDELRRAAEEWGLQGVKLNPGRQRFFPNDPQFYPLWESSARLGLIVLFHIGMMGAGAGTPGGLGYKLKHTRPNPHLDDIAADFPELTIIAAHPSWPWQEEALAMARHKSNVYIDLSGWSPKYFPPSLVQHANSLLQGPLSLRLRLADADPGALAGGLPGAGPEGAGAPEDPARERPQAPADRRAVSGEGT